MLKNHLIIAWRNLLRHRKFSLVNIAGLSIGMAACLLILLFVQDEYSYDQYHEKKDRMYRITAHIGFADMHFASTCNRLGPALEGGFEGFEAVGRLFERSAGMSLEAAPDKAFVEDNFFFADSGIMKIFTFDYLLGEGENALRQPNSLVLTREVAEKYFGKGWEMRNDVYGSTFLVEGRETFKVTAVVEDIPHNSHWKPRVLASFANMYTIDGEVTGETLKRNWLFNPFHHYVLAKEGAWKKDEIAEAEGVKKLEEELNAWIQENTPEVYKDNNTLYLQKVTDIHLQSDLGLEIDQNGNMRTIHIFISIALIILLIACINFINLSTARSLKRAREVGMRKVLGARRGQLIRQFLGESLLLSIVALFVALSLMQFLMPVLNNLTGKELSIYDLLQWEVIGGAIGVVWVTGLLAGSYPAFFISRFKAVVSLKGTVSESVNKGQLLRKGLVGMQLFLSIALIACSMILYQQVDYLRNKPLGFQTEQMIAMPVFTENLNLALIGGVDSTLRQRMNTFEEALLNKPGVNAITLAARLPGLGAVNHNVIPEGFTREDNIYIANASVDYDYIATIGLEVIAGRDFDQSFGTDHTNAFILNEQAVQLFGWEGPEDALGRHINREGKEGSVIGVVKDYHFLSLENAIEPMMLDINTGRFTQFLVQVDAQNMPQTIDRLKATWETHFPEKVFSYSFLDSRLEEVYQDQIRLGKIVGYFSFLAVLVACLGLFGLMAFMIEGRRREIGIRKILGASAGQIMQLLSSDFVVLLAIAFILAVPSAWYVMNLWLEDFAFHIDLGVGVFVLAGLLVGLLAFVTMSTQSLRAARANPVEALRDE